MHETNKKYLLLCLCVFAGMVAGCASFKGEIPVEGNIPEIVIISPQNGDGIMDTLDIPLSFPKKEGLEITGFEFAVIDSAGATVYAETGLKQGNTPLKLPEKIFWTGKNAQGKWAADGEYAGSFTAKDALGNTGKIAAPKIVVDNTSPVIAVKLAPLPFTPDNNGENDLLNIAVTFTDLAGIKEWSALINDPTGQPFIALDTAKFKDGVFAWDGRSGTGELVQSASDYSLVIKAIDKAGNKAEKQESVPIDILIIRDGDRLKISISSIYFKAFTADFQAVAPALAKKNNEILDKLAVVLQKYADYNIQLEGHAVRVYWDDPKKGEKEEKEVLLPLSKQRADAIREALIKRGVKKERLTTVGLGSSKPIVPHKDKVNNWKNRRVEFILIKK